jgi:hypothetical protein
MSKITRWAIVFLVMLVAVSIAQYHYVNDPPNCPHFTLDKKTYFNKPYPNVIAKHGIEVYECKDKTMFLIKNDPGL